MISTSEKLQSSDSFYSSFSETMAPYQAFDSQGSPKQLSPKSSSLEIVSVSKESHNMSKPVAGGGTPFRREWQTAGTHTIQAPTIRVIHIFAPKVIKTDVANFRSTVQKLTGRNTRKSQRRARTKTVSKVIVPNQGCAVMGGSQGCASFAGPQLWDQESSQKEVLQGLVVDACGSDHLHRSNSRESTSFSLESNTSNDTTDLSSPSELSFPQCCFTQDTEQQYSLDAIPAPFFGSVGSDMVQTCFADSSPTFSNTSSHGSVRNLENGFQLPHVMDSSMSLLSFEADISESGLGSSLLSDFPFLNPLGGTSSGGSLYELMPQQYCRLSAVHQPFQGSGAFFESI